MDIQRGDLIRVRAYGNKELVLYLLEVRGETVILTTPEEYGSLTKENKEPVSIGFPISDVIKVEKRKKAKT